MKKTFTFSDCILFAYDELNERKKIELKNALTSNNKLSLQVQEIVQTKKYLDDAFNKPSDFVITNILNYSKSLEVIKTKNCFPFIFIKN